MKRNFEIDSLYQGDCVEVMKREIPDNSLNMIFADPPYNLSGNGMRLKGSKTGGDWYMMNESWDVMPEEEYFDFTFSWLKEAVRVLKESASIYVSCTYHNIGEIILNMKKCGISINNVITWYKTNAMPNMTRRVYTHSTEFIVWGVKGKGWTFNYDELKKINPEKRRDGKDKQMRDLWAIPLVQGKERLHREDGRAAHPTQKPLEILKRIITASSKEGEIILDPFAGSGTTLVVAKEMKRHYLGIEKSPEYIKLIKKRLKYDRK